MANPKLKILALLVAVQFASVSAAQLKEHNDYAFMSAQDLYDALEIEAPIALGYLLGIVDGLKGRLAGNKCFSVPWTETADQIIKETYMEYWQDNFAFHIYATDAIIEAMSRRFPC